MIAPATGKRNRPRLPKPQQHTLTYACGHQRPWLAMTEEQAKRDQKSLGKSLCPECRLKDGREVVRLLRFQELASAGLPISSEHHCADCAAPIGLPVLATAAAEISGAPRCSLCLQSALDAAERMAA